MWAEVSRVGAMANNFPHPTARHSSCRNAIMSQVPHCLSSPGSWPVFARMHDVPGRSSSCADAYAGMHADEDSGTDMEGAAHQADMDTAAQSSPPSNADSSSPKRQKVSDSQLALPAGQRSSADDVCREAAWHILSRPDAAAASGLSHVPHCPSDVTCTPLSVVLSSMRIVSPQELHS